MKSSKATVWASALLPVVLLGGLLFFFWRTSGGLRFDAPAPIEQLAFERVVLKPNEIIAHVRNVGPGELTIAQVQIGWMHRSSWEFTAEPSAKIPRLGTARVRIPYPWIAGEPYEIALFSANSIVFAHEIEIAYETPRFSARSFGEFAMLGIYVGVLPVFLGILWLPFLRQLGPTAYGFLISLTIGLLVFLGVDALHDALEAGGELPGPFQGVALILIGVTVSLLGLHVFARWVEGRKRAAGGDMSLTLAYLVAFSIGIHNLGEGLAIGGAYALGEIATGALLIIGFMIHNLTEGVAIVSPIVRTGASLGHLLWMGAIAGLPTILGTSLGAFAPSPVFAVLFLSIGAGAVFQVVFEIGSQMWRGQQANLLSPANLGGFLAGLGVMYVTGLFLAV